MAMQDLISCPRCDSKFDVEDLAPGTIIECLKCKSAFEVPGKPETEADPDIRKTRTEDRKPPAGSGTEGQSKEVASDRNRKKTSRTRRVDRRGIPTGNRTTWAIVAGVCGTCLAAGVVILIVSASGGRNPAASSKRADREANLLAVYDRLRTRAGDDPAALLSLAVWTREQGLETQSLEAYRKIVRVESAHAAARAGLRQVLFQGKWIPLRDFGAIVAETAAAHRDFDRPATVRWTPRFLLLGDAGIDASELAAAAARLEELVSTWARKRARDLEDLSIRRDRLPRRRVFVVADRAFAALCARRGSEGGAFYSPADGTLYTSWKVARGALMPDEFILSWYGKGKKITSLPARAVEAVEVMGREIALVRSRHFLVAVQEAANYSAQAAASKYAELLEILYAQFFALFSPRLRLTPPTELMPMFIFRNQEAYVAYGARTGKRFLLSLAEGHYEPKEQRMLSFKRQRESKYGTVLHEGTHLLMHFLTTKRIPSRSMWFSEGIADYLGGWAMMDGKMVLGRINHKRYRDLKAMARQNRHLRLNRIIPFTYLERQRYLARRDWTTRRKQLFLNMVYQGAWGFTHFLMHGQEGKYRDRYFRYVAFELSGRSDPRIFLYCFRGVDLKKLDEEYRAYLLRF